MEAAQTKSCSRKPGANSEASGSRNSRVHKIIQNFHYDYRIVAEDVVSYWRNRIHNELFEITFSLMMGSLCMSGS